MAVINKNGTYMALPSAIKRGSATALDTTSVWYDRALMEFYAQGGGKLGEVEVPITAYVGQVLTLVDETNNTATAYIIEDVAGNLNEVGSSTLGDNASIELVDGKLSVKDFGRKYYKYVEAVEGGEAAHYELTEGWVANLEPRVVDVDDELVIGWFEPNPTTAEGVKDQVVEVQGEVEQAKEDISNLDEILNGTEENPGGLVGEVEDIADILYGIEGENPVPGLIENVETLDEEIAAVAKDLADNYYTKTETYSKTEVDGLVSGVFHFEGTAESYEALPSENNTKGDVYQVGDKEYAWDGNNWVELGYVVDLSNYYTKAEADAEIKKVQDAVDGVADDVAENAQAIADNATAIESLTAADTAIEERIDNVAEEVNTVSGKVNAIESTQSSVADEITALQEVDTATAARIDSVESDISTLEEADAALDTRLDTVEEYVGTPSGDLGALYPAVESINERLNKIVAEGGEPNQLNGIIVDGSKLTPNDSLLVTLPNYNGTGSGLVPVISDDLKANGAENYFLNAAGSWAVPVDGRIGALNGFSTVEEYVEDYVTGAIQDALAWEKI